MTIDEKIKQRPEVKILVFFALMLSLVAIPYIFIVYRTHLLTDRPGLSNSLLEGLFAVSAVLAVFLMQRTPGHLPLASYGFRWRGIVSQTAIGAGIGLAIMSAVINVLRLTGHYQIENVNPSFSVLSPAVLYLFVAIFEETVFRGFIFVTLEDKWGSFVALTTTSLLFGLAHLVDTVPGVSFAHHLRSAIFIGFEAGILLTAAFMLTRSLWLGIGIHWAWNFFEGPFYGASVSGTNDVSTFYRAHTMGSQLLTGGTFGPEGGIVCLIIGTLTGLWMLRLVIKQGQWRRNPELVLAPSPMSEIAEKS